MITKEEKRALAARIRMGETDPKTTHNLFRWWRLVGPRLSSNYRGYILGVFVGAVDYDDGSNLVMADGRNIPSTFPAILEWLESD